MSGKYIFQMKMYTIDNLILSVKKILSTIFVRVFDGLFWIEMILLYLEHNNLK